MRKGIWFVALLPLLYILYRLSFGIEFLRDGVEVLHSIVGGKSFPSDPLKFMADLLGITAIQLLIVTLSITPLRQYTPLNFIKYRRLVGLWAFFYAFLHSLFFFIAENEGSPALMLEDAYKRPFVFFGLAAFLILFFMAMTSPKKLFKKFVKWHKLVYVAVIFISLHFAMSQRVIGWDVMAYIMIFIGLLALRLIKRS